jgi:hypothetical protein
MSTASAPQTGFGLLTEQERNDETAERPAQRYCVIRLNRMGRNNGYGYASTGQGVAPTADIDHGRPADHLLGHRYKLCPPSAIPLDYLEQPFQRINQTLWRTARSGGVTSGPRSVRRLYRKIPADAFVSPQGGKPSPDIVEIGVTRGNACPESVPQDGWQAKRRLG